MLATLATSQENKGFKFLRIKADSSKKKVHKKKQKKSVKVERPEDDHVHEGLRILGL